MPMTNENITYFPRKLEFFEGDTIYYVCYNDEYNGSGYAGPGSYGASGSGSDAFTGPWENTCVVSNPGDDEGYWAETELPVCTLSAYDYHNNE